MNSIKTIFLDWNGTICNNVFWQQLDNSSTKEIFEKIKKCLFIDNGNLIDPWMKNQLSMNDIIDIISNETKINKQFLKEQLIFSSENMNFINPEIPNIIKLIQEKGIKVVLASDNMDVFRYTISKLKLDLLFDDLLLSNEIGFLKTEWTGNTSLFFKNYIKRKNLNLSECILIDDAKNLIDICHDIGMQNLKIDNCHETINKLKIILQ